MFASAFYPSHHEFSQLFQANSPRCAYRHGPSQERRRAHHGRPLGHHQAYPFYTAQYYVVPDERPKDTKVDPKISLSQSDEAYGIEAEIPGFAREQITVEFTDSKTLRLHGSTAPVAPEPSASEPIAQNTEGETRATTESADHERTRSRSPKRTSVEEVRDETETDYVEVASEDRAGSPIFTESRTVSPAPQPQPQTTIVKETRQEALRPAAVATRSFEKLIDLPRDIDRNGVSAELKDGILKIRVARIRPDESRRRIVVA